MISFNPSRPQADLPRHEGHEAVVSLRTFTSIGEATEALINKLARHVVHGVDNQEGRA
jgi:hypothetical protein